MIIDQKVYDDISRILVEQRLIREMANERKSALFKIDVLADTFAEHMFKIICVRASSTTDYWKKEVINNYVTKLNKLCSVVVNKKVVRFSVPELNSVLWKPPLGHEVDVKNIIAGPKFRNEYPEKWFPLITKHTDILHSMLSKFYSEFLPMLAKGDVANMVNLINSQNND